MSSKEYQTMVAMVTTGKKEHRWHWVATIAPPLVDNKHYNSFPSTPIGVDLLCLCLTPTNGQF